MSKQRRLGRGIDALLQGRDISQLESGDINSVVSVPIDQLVGNPNQPRRVFDQQALEELAQSIGERGIIQPILAELQDDDTYLIIAGERRFRAAQMAGLTAVPVLPGVFSEDEKLEIALIENIQRKDLTAIEEATAYRELMDRLALSQDELAKRLGRSRPAVANSVRLLKLPAAVQEMVASGGLSGGHARTLLALEDDAQIAELAPVVVEQGLSVRALERLVGSVNAGAALDAALQGEAEPRGNSEPEGTPHRATDRPAETPTPDSRKTVEMRQLEEQLIERLGTRVVLSGTNDRGKIEIQYLSMADLERLSDLIRGL